MATATAIGIPRPRSSSAITRIWAVGRAIDIDNRKTPPPRPDDYVFEGYEMGDALSAANNALEDDLKVSAGEGVNEAVAPFAEDELLKPLERWFFGHKH